MDRMSVPAALPVALLAQRMRCLTEEVAQGGHKCILKQLIWQSNARPQTSQVLSRHFWAQTHEAASDRSERSFRSFINSAMLRSLQLLTVMCAVCVCRGNMQIVYLRKTVWSGSTAAYALRCSILETLAT